MSKTTDQAGELLDFQVQQQRVGRIQERNTIIGLIDQLLVGFNAKDHYDLGYRDALHTLRKRLEALSK